MRLSPLHKSDLTPRQIEILHSTLGLSPEDELPPPFYVWARHPELAYWVEGLGAYCRSRSKHPQRLRELSVLIVARHFDSQSAWNAHIEQAVAEGVPAESLDRLARGEDPKFEAQDERLFHAFAREMLEDHFVSQETYDAALALFGEDGLLDLIGCIGSFSMSALMLNTVQLPLRTYLPRPFQEVDGFRRVAADGHA
ncbi:carboxymuconolactone decarboxylase family protein [Streptomyces sp. NPDC005820]|uniref:carboxymuconolactone decarboxylase family protein n=1 Tax=Streptomyces sp. NPDC005820 TaxID=3157069 RepID=UPI0033C7E78E